MEDRCVSCGAIIPEGRQVCEDCEKGDRKFTDDEVIKALRCCVGTLECIDCPYTATDYYAKKNTEDAIALINRQKAEIERLTSKAHRYERYYFNHEYDKLEAEAIKEFAIRLKEKAYVHKPYGMSRSVDEYEIDNIVKEMTEGGEPRKDVGE